MNQPLLIIAGPCSIDDHNIKEIYAIADIEAAGKRAIAGTRVVGLKSRTALDPAGEGMGIDYPAYVQNLQILSSGGSTKDFILPPSVTKAQTIAKDTNMLIATEIMEPFLQMPHYVGLIPADKLLPWNPAVNQLGWPLMTMAKYCIENDWHLGIKNPKWVGEHVQLADQADYPSHTTMEKTWAGLAAYANGLNGHRYLIMRGVDVPDKENYRNLPVHQIAARTKVASGAKLLFDPSHAYGPKMREHIVDAVINAMHLKMSDGTYLYDGMLIETGTSTTDTEQHISIAELKDLVNKLASYRDILSPDTPQINISEPTVTANA